MPVIVLGVSGSVAAYRACDLARDLMRAGHTVHVCLTDAAQNFVRPAQFEALTGRQTLVDTFEEPVPGRMAHIDLARSADLVLVAPATANTLSKIAHGQGDDMLTTLCIAYEGPIVVAPAMNPTMYANEATQAALSEVSRRGAVLVEPQEGDVACGESGQGKLASNAAILDAVATVLARSRALAGKKVVVTSGPTRERWDDVRYLSNRSSGKMGMALARAAQLMGAEVVLVTGPTGLVPPRTVLAVQVESAEEMLTEALRASAGADLVIGAAAVADYRPAEPIPGKFRRSQDEIVLRLAPNPDVIAEVARQSGAVCAAFAAEPTADLESAKLKMAKKGVAAIASNDVSRTDIGFGSDSNELALLFSDGEVHHSGVRTKLACAFWMLELLAKRLG